MQAKTCTMGSCPKCWGGKSLILGILVLLNVYYAKLDWATFVGAILVLKGLLHMAMPYCPHCK